MNRPRGAARIRLLIAALGIIAGCIAVAWWSVDRGANQRAEPTMALPAAAGSATSITLTPAPTPQLLLAADPTLPATTETQSIHAEGSGTRGCLACHTEASGPALNRPTVADVCSHCHADSHDKKSHPVDVPLAPGMTTSLPLSRSGRVDCGTCHDPHAHTSPMLRLDTNSLCMHCHKGY